MESTTAPSGSVGATSVVATAGSVMGQHQQQSAMLGRIGAAGGAASSIALAKSDFHNMIAELREQNFDTIRFATYRAACKLRFVQKKVNLHLVDIWNVIESFRENGLNAVEYRSEVKVSRIELLLSTVYHNLNKRLPVAQQIDTDASIGLLLSFLLGAYDRDDTGRLKVFSIKIALATICAGKLIDKLRYIFSQISDSAGQLVEGKFGDYLREVLALPTAVFEGPSFGYSQQAVDACLAQLAAASCANLGQPPSHASQQSLLRMNVNSFLDTLMTDPCPPCLMWLPLLHRMASVEHVFHPVVCDGCNVESFTGFRYRCQRCANYQLCQDCFWRGRTSAGHSNQHEMKEYSSYKSPAKQLSHSIGKSLRCAPGRAAQQTMATHPGTFPDQPERTLDLSNVVPATPSLIRDAYPEPDVTYLYDELSLGSVGGSPARLMMGDGVSYDDEHKLIARYSAKLAGRTSYPLLGGGGMSSQRRRLLGAAASVADDDHVLSQRALIAQLEQSNREIQQEIQHLQTLRGSDAYRLAPGLSDTGLSNELETLRERNNELDRRMQQLKDTRRDLMAQLQHILRALKSGVDASQQQQQLSTQQQQMISVAEQGSLSGIGGQVQSAFRDPSALSAATQPIPMSKLGSLPGTLPRTKGAASSTGLQGILLSAAEGITDTVSSLVNEMAATSEANEELNENSAQILKKSAARSEANSFVNGNQKTTDESVLASQQEEQNRVKKSRKTIGEMIVNNPFNDDDS